MLEMKEGARAADMARGKNKERILQAGLDLMYVQGYNGTGIQEIADAAGVPKGSFYNYFKSKEAFAVEALALYTEGLAEYLRGALLEGEESSALERMKALFESWSATLFPKYGGKGCFAANLTQEMARQSPTLQAALEEAYEALETPFVENVRRAQAAGEIRGDLEPELLGKFIYNAWQGSQLRAKAMGGREPLDQFASLIFGVLAGTT